mgnify:CR=1 FL=1|jgi:hypothetical protein|tara:strand:+ start:1281 stop:1454 length:174 start_codon:yes stop_codon:yes gene_type:complete
MPYILIKDDKVMQHIVMQGNLKKNWKRDQEVVDIVFDTLESANENATALNATVKKVA